MNNMLPFAGCASHTWSTAVQMQFFLLAPLVLLLLRPAFPNFRCGHMPSSTDNSPHPGPLKVSCPAGYQCYQLWRVHSSMSDRHLDLTVP